MWEIFHCTLCAYCVHIIVQFTLYTLVYSSHCTLHTAHLYNALSWASVGGVHITLYTVHCIDALHTVQFTLYLQIYLLVHCPCTSVHLCTCALYLYLTSGTCTSLKVPHSRYLTASTCSTLCCRCLDNMCIRWLFYMVSLHRVTIVLAGVLQVGLQVSSSLAFLLAGGQLSHTLCTTVPCILYSVHGVTSSSRYVQEFSLL